LGADEPGGENSIFVFDPSKQEKKMKKKDWGKKGSDRGRDNQNG